MWATEDMERCERRTKRCTDCSRAIPRDRSAKRCADCVDIARDAERIESGQWLPNGKGTLVWVPGEVV